MNLDDLEVDGIGKFSFACHGLTSAKIQNR